MPENSIMSAIHAGAKTLARPFMRLGFIKSGLRGIYLKRRLAFPSMVQIEVTNTCNARCIMCPHQKMTRTKALVSGELVSKVVQECAANKDKVLTFLPNHFGEPLLNPRLPEYVAQVRAALPDAEICIFTNGALLTEERGRALIEAGLDLINISFDGFTKETYEKIRVNLNFDEVNANVEGFIKLRNSMGRKKPLVNLAFVAMPENIKEVAPFREKWTRLADTVTIGTFCNWGGEIPGEVTSSVRNTERRPCTRLWSHMLVLNNGDVPLCCQDYNGENLLGNVVNSSIAEVWHGEKLERIRKLHLERRFDALPICRDCNFWQQQNEPIWWWE